MLEVQHLGLLKGGVLLLKTCSILVFYRLDRRLEFLEMSIKAQIILEHLKYSNILDFLGITCCYWLLEYSRIFIMKYQVKSFAYLSEKSKKVGCWIFW